MKRLLLASFAAWVVGAGSDALAADFPPPVAPPPQAPAAYLAPGPYYSWTGFYIGGNVGGGVSSGGNASDTALSTFRYLRTPPSSVAAKLALTTSSTTMSSSAPKPCSIGFPITPTQSP